MPPAARITDPVAHPLPPVLTGGPTAVTVLIGFLPAWRGVNPAVAAAMQAAKAISDTAITVAEAATVAAAGRASPAYRPGPRTPWPRRTRPGRRRPPPRPAGPAARGRAAVPPTRRRRRGPREGWLPSRPSRPPSCAEHNKNRHEQSSWREVR